RNGAPLAPDVIAHVRQWIESGAFPAGQADIALPVPASGFQLRIPPFDVLPGSEVRRNYYLKTPNTDTVAATRVEFLQPPGSHRFDIFTADLGDRPDGAFEDAPPDLRFDLFSLRASTQGRLDWTLPPGVGILVKPRQQFQALVHFANTGGQVS